MTDNLLSNVYSHGSGSNGSSYKSLQITSGKAWVDQSVKMCIYIAPFLYSFQKCPYMFEASTKLYSIKLYSTDFIIFQFRWKTVPVLAQMNQNCTVISSNSPVFWDGLTMFEHSTYVPWSVCSRRSCRFDNNVCCLDTFKITQPEYVSQKSTGSLCGSVCCKTEINQCSIMATFHYRANRN